MSGSVQRRFTALLIVLATSACDNVEWGGVQVSLEPPDGEADTTTVAAPGEVETPEETGGPVLPQGPTLFMATRIDRGRVSVRPVAEVGRDTLIPLPLDRDQPGFSEIFARTRMAPGTAFTLFAQGARVGTVRVDSLTFQPGRCSGTPVATGVVELIPEALEATRFVALREGAGAPRRPGGFRPQDHSYDQRVAGLAMAADAISSTGAPWPSSVLETRADMQAIPLDGDRSGAFAATFLFQDALRVGPPLTPSAYGIFVLGTGGPEAYELAYMDYRPVNLGKAAIRFFEQGDWDADGESELLLEVFGEQARWTAALDRRDGQWVRVFEESCAPATASP